MAEGSLNNKIEVAWMQARQAQPEARKDRREFQTRFCHLAADQLGTSVDRVRERVIKIERRENAAITIDPAALEVAVEKGDRETLIMLGLGRYV